MMTCGGSRGLVFGSLVTEKEFLSRRNAAQFSGLMRRMEYVAQLIGLNSIRMCGILPSTAAKRGETFFEDTSHVAARVVVQAFEEVRRTEMANDTGTLAILLGGAGLVGTQVADMMREANIPTAILDPAAGKVDLSVFQHEGPMVLIDVARKGVLEKYLTHLPEGIVVLNETYPEPGKRVRQALKRKNATLLHIRGVEGSVWPHLPGGYTDAIPCCGAPTDGRELTLCLSRLETSPGRSRPAQAPRPVVRPVPGSAPLPEWPAIAIAA